MSTAGLDRRTAIPTEGLDEFLLEDYLRRLKSGDLPRGRDADEQGRIDAVLGHLDQEYRDRYGQSPSRAFIPRPVEGPEPYRQTGNFDFGDLHHQLTGPFLARTGELGRFAASPLLRGVWPDTDRPRNPAGPFAQMVEDYAAQAGAFRENIRADDGGYRYGEAYQAAHQAPEYPGGLGLAAEIIGDPLNLVPFASLSKPVSAAGRIADVVQASGRLAGARQAGSELLRGVQGYPAALRREYSFSLPRRGILAPAETAYAAGRDEFLDAEFVNELERATEYGRQINEITDPGRRKAASDLFVAWRNQLSQGDLDSAASTLQELQYTLGPARTSMPVPREIPGASPATFEPTRQQAIDLIRRNVQDPTTSPGTGVIGDVYGIEDPGLRTILGEALRAGRESGRVGDLPLSGRDILAGALEHLENPFYTAPTRTSDIRTQALDFLRGQTGPVSREMLAGIADPQVRAVVEDAIRVGAAGTRAPTTTPFDPLRSAAQYLESPSYTPPIAGEAQLRGAPAGDDALSRLLQGEGPSQGPMPFGFSTRTFRRASSTSIEDENKVLMRLWQRRGQGQVDVLPTEQHPGGRTTPASAGDSIEGIAQATGLDPERVTRVLDDLVNPGQAPRPLSEVMTADAFQGEAPTAWVSKVGDEYRLTPQGMLMADALQAETPAAAAGEGAVQMGLFGDAPTARGGVRGDLRWPPHVGGAAPDEQLGQMQSAMGGDLAPADAPQGTMFGEQDLSQGGVDPAITEEMAARQARQRELDAGQTDMFGEGQAGAGQVEEVAPPAPTEAITDATGQTRVRLVDIVTRPEQFQGRGGFDADRARRMAETWWDPNDPTKPKTEQITVWKDPENGQYVVIAGHHRLEAMRLLPSIPSKRHLVEEFVPVNVLPEGTTAEQAQRLAYASNNLVEPTTITGDRIVIKSFVDANPEAATNDAAFVKVVQEDAPGFGRQHIIDVLNVDAAGDNLFQLVEADPSLLKHIASIGKHVRAGTFNVNDAERIWRKLTRNGERLPSRTELDAYLRSHVNLIQEARQANFFDEALWGELEKDPTAPSLSWQISELESEELLSLQATVAERKRLLASTRTRQAKGLSSLGEAELAAETQGDITRLEESQEAFGEMQKGVVRRLHEVQERLRAGEGRLTPEQQVQGDTPTAGVEDVPIEQVEAPPVAAVRAEPVPLRPEEITAVLEGSGGAMYMDDLFLELKKVHPTLGMGQLNSHIVMMQMAQPPLLDPMTAAHSVALPAGTGPGRTPGATTKAEMLADKLDLESSRSPLTREPIDPSNPPQSPREIEGRLLEYSDEASRALNDPMPRAIPTINITSTWLPSSPKELYRNYLYQVHLEQLRGTPADLAAYRILNSFPDDVRSSLLDGAEAVGGGQLRQGMEELLGISPPGIPSAGEMSHLQEMARNLPGPSRPFGIVPPAFDTALAASMREAEAAGEAIRISDSPGLKDYLDGKPMADGGGDFGGNGIGVGHMLSPDPFGSGGIRHGGYVQPMLPDPEDAKAYLVRHDFWQKAANILYDRVPGGPGLVRAINATGTLPKAFIGAQAKVLTEVLREWGDRGFAPMFAQLERIGSEDKVFGPKIGKGFLNLRQGRETTLLGPNPGTGLVNLGVNPEDVGKVHAVTAEGQPVRVFVQQIAENPSRFQLTDKQKQWLETAQIMNQAPKKILEAYGQKVGRFDPASEFFVGRTLVTRTSADGDIIDLGYVGGGSGLTSVANPAKHRTFNTMGDAVAMGFRPEHSYTETMLIRIRSAMREAVNIKIGTWLSDYLRQAEQGNVQGLQVLSPEEGARAGEVNIRLFERTPANPNLQLGLDSAASRPIEQVGAELQSTEFRLAPSPKAQDIRAFKETMERDATRRMQDGFIRAADEVSNQIRFLKLTADLSLWSIQGLFAMALRPAASIPGIGVRGGARAGGLRLYNRPSIGADMIQLGIRGMANHEWMLTTRAARLDEFTQRGSHLKHPRLVLDYSGKSEYTRGADLLSKFPVAGPIFRNFAQMFDAVRDIVALNMAELSEDATQHILDPAKRQAIINAQDEMTNKSLGRLSIRELGISGGMRQLQRGLFFLAPSYYRATAGNVIQAIGNPLDPRHGTAQLMLLKAVGTLSFLVAGMNYASAKMTGQSDEQARGQALRSINPTSGDFASVVIPKLDFRVSLGGSVKAMWSLLAETVFGEEFKTGREAYNFGPTGIEGRFENVYRFWEGRQSPFTRMVTDISKGEDFIGRTTRPWTADGIQRFVRNQTLPLAIDAAIDDFDTENLLKSVAMGLSSGAGLNVWELRKTDIRERTARSIIPSSNYDDLESWAKKYINGLASGELLALDESRNRGQADPLNTAYLGIQGQAAITEREQALIELAANPSLDQWALTSGWREANTLERGRRQERTDAYDAIFGDRPDSLPEGELEEAGEIFFQILDIENAELREQALTSFDNAYPPASEVGQYIRRQTNQQRVPMALLLRLENNSWAQRVVASGLARADELQRLVAAEEGPERALEERNAYLRWFFMLDETQAFLQEQAVTPEPTAVPAGF